MSSVLEELQEIHEHDRKTERISLRNKNLEDIELIIEYLETQFPNLRHLDLSQNQLTQLPMEIGRKLPKLIALDLSENKFSSIYELIQVLQHCTSLRSLNISLKNITEEKILLASLQSLCVLNGTPVSMSNKRKTHNTVSSKPIEKQQPGPQLSEGTMDLRNRFTESRKLLYPSNKLKAEVAAMQVKSSSSTSPIPSDTSAETAIGYNKCTLLRPTESPARISDDKTDWQKLLKYQQEQQEKQDAYHTQLKSFVSELKKSLATFHTIGTSNASSTSPSIQMLETQMDRITEKLERLPLRCSTKEEELKAKCHLLMTKSSLLQLCGQFGVNKTSQIDGKLAFGVHQLLQVHEQVLHDLQHTLMEAVTLVVSLSSCRPNENSPAVVGNGSNHNEKSTSGIPKQQLESILEVAEQLEKELEQAKMAIVVHENNEKQLFKENATLKRQMEMIKQKNSQKSSSSYTSSLCQAPPPSFSSLIGPLPPPPTSFLPLRGSLLSSNVSTQNEPPRYQQPTSSYRARMRVRKRQEGENLDDISSSLPLSGNQKIKETREATKRANGGSGGEKANGVREIVAAAEVSSQVQQWSQGFGTGQQSIRKLTLKQLLDLIHCILISKEKHNIQVMQSHGTMCKETMEQHLYTFLNQRFGLQNLIVDYASAILKACHSFYQQNNQIAMFLHLLQNKIDENFIQIQKNLQKTLVFLLKAFFQAKFPLKTEQALLEMVKNRLENNIYQEEWTNIVQYLYDPMDTQVLIRLLQREAAHLKQNFAVPYPLFEKLLCDYQLYARLELLKEFYQLFQQEDVENLGQIKRVSKELSFTL
jgi:hypothetical protein